MNLKLVGQLLMIHQLYYNQNSWIHVCTLHFDYHLYLTHFPIGNWKFYVKKCLAVKLMVNSFIDGNYHDLNN